MGTTDKATSSAEHVRVLQSSRLLNPDLSLREIVRAAQKIPGLGEGGPTSWELIGRDFVFRGLPEPGSKEEKENRVLNLSVLEESKIINFDLTLGELLKTAAQIPGLEGAGPTSWELIGRDFVLRGRAPSELPRELNRNG